ncbi:hypothetical protein BH688_15190 [Kushneria phosphatilytica]|uniref:VIT family protein n=2 Tax=Kushneria phosphatilytica TaxID=657387 RepID=A0A1S1NRY4_9GAMM|nr:hypothetical protein BH688_15190 [Kushneria phosphatilytica]QEL12675.1 VIT family protein [Kushneria phosphatilytica]
MATQKERHYTSRIGWLRAAVLGANDGIVSTASLIVGVAASSATHGSIVLTGLAGCVAGAMSMAAGEYVSVSSQADTERADLVREQGELDRDYDDERRELAEIYRQRGLEPDLALTVADQLMAHDALAAHARDELGLSTVHRARPIQAALASALTFLAGALLPVLLTVFSPWEWVIPVVGSGALLALALLGGVSARVGGASMLMGAARVVFWGVLAMLFTAAVGKLFGGGG